MDFLLWEGEYWRIFQNKFPYSGDARHIMATPKNHRIFSADLMPEEWSEFALVHHFVRDFYKGESYFSCTRETLSNRSVEHLHIHFLP